MTVLQQLAPADLRRIVSTYRDALRAHQEELNRLNVYPVPDGDTGTNMALTLESVVGELDDAAAARPMERGVRGDPPRLAHGCPRQLGRDPLADPAGPRRHVRAARRGRRAPTSPPGCGAPPTPRTRRCCARSRARSSPSCASAAEAVEQAVADGETTLAGVLERAAAAARDAVARTPDLLPVLREAGVVDAGGRGLRAAARRVPRRRVAAARSPSPRSCTPASRSPRTWRRRDDVADLRYEVMYFLDAPDDARSTGFKRAWGALGDSIVVVGGDGLWNCHVHTNDIGAAIEAGIDAGRPREIRVTDLIEQVEEERWVRDVGCRGRPRRHADRARVTTAVVAVAVGDGLRAPAARASACSRWWPAGSR